MCYLASTNKKFCIIYSNLSNDNLREKKKKKKTNKQTEERDFNEIQ